MADPAGKKGETQSKADAPKVDLTPDPVISDLIAHFGEPQGAVVLIGYLAPSPKGTDYVRFYWDLDLRTYCDIPAKEIVRRERVERSDDANASKIIVRATLKLELVQVVERKEEVEASFLRGVILSAYPVGTSPTLPGGQSPQTIWFATPQHSCTCLWLEQTCKPQVTGCKTQDPNVPPQ